MGHNRHSKKVTIGIAKAVTHENHPALSPDTNTAPLPPQREMGQLYRDQRQAVVQGRFFRPTSRRTSSPCPCRGTDWTRS